MKVSVLSSGSTGNSTLIETPQHKILMDAGLSGKKTKDLLAQVGVDIKDIDMVFISHDHTDHSGGLGVLMRRYPKISAYANSGTWNYLIESNKIGKLPVEPLDKTDTFKFLYSFESSAAILFWIIVPVNAFTRLRVIV